MGVLQGLNHGRLQSFGGRYPLLSGLFGALGVERLSFHRVSERADRPLFVDSSLGAFRLEFVKNPRQDFDLSLVELELMRHESEGSPNPEEGPVVPASHRFSPEFAPIGVMFALTATGAPGAPPSSLKHCLSSRRGARPVRVSSGSAVLANPKRGHAASRTSKINLAGRLVKIGLVGLVSILAATRSSHADERPSSPTSAREPAVQACSIAPLCKPWCSLDPLAYDRTFAIEDDQRPFGSLETQQCLRVGAEGPMCAPSTSVHPGEVEDGVLSSILEAPALVRATEGRPVEFTVDSDVRVFALGLPPGSEFKEGRFRWVPDFIQGGSEYAVTFIAPSADRLNRASTRIRVHDRIRPPSPRVVARIDRGDYYELTIRQRTDRFLDSPRKAGREFQAKVVVPKAAGVSILRPVQLDLHGFYGRPLPKPAEGHIRIYPHDPENTYWWGYARTRARPKTTTGVVPNYSQRRALHLMSWALETIPQADAEAVYVSGESMGGAGALALGLLYAHHFAGVESEQGQTIARNHRPRRIEQLSMLWGAPADGLLDGDPLNPMSVWDRLDMVRALFEDPAARNQFIYSRHSKDDPVIHFGAVLQASPASGVSFYQALQQLRVGHYVVWDEGGHGIPDPALGERWWDDGWDRYYGPETYLRRNLAFPAFSASSADDDPGDGQARDERPWDPERGYGGDWRVPGDTGWTGDIAGAWNRYLRWNSRTIVDQWDRFEVSLRAVDGPPGPPPPVPAFSSVRDGLARSLPVRVDVTPRRTQAFRCRPGERIYWSFGGQEGEIFADETGAVTVSQLNLTSEYQRLVLKRTAEPAPYP